MNSKMSKGGIDINGMKMDERVKEVKVKEWEEEKGERKKEAQEKRKSEW